MNKHDNSTPTLSVPSKEAARDRLRNSLLDLDEDIFKLRSYDKIEEINTSCDDQEARVSLFVDSAIEHLLKIKSELIQKISTHREALLSQIGERNSWREDLTRLTTDLDLFRQKCHDALEKSDQEIDSFCIERRNEMEEYKSRLQCIKKLQRRETFENGIVKFNENPLFLIDYELIGTIELSAPAIEPEGPKEVEAGKIFNSITLLAKFL